VTFFILFLLPYLNKKTNISMIVPIADKVYWTLVQCSMTEADTGFLLPA